MNSEDIPFFHEVTFTKGSQRKVQFKCPTCSTISIRTYRMCIDATVCNHCFKTNKKEEYEIIPFEEAKLTYSFGSHKKVIWHCKDCNKNEIKSFKIALKTKRCKPCNNIVRPKKDFKGENNPFFGKKHTEDTIKKLSGSNNTSWKPQLTQEDRVYNRNGLPGYVTWVRLIKERFEYTCQKCFTKDSKMESHHIFSYKKNKELRTDINNGTCLCSNCHIEFHRKYGKEDNSRTQLDEFLDNHLILTK